jgi:hypothetical protein
VIQGDGAQPLLIMQVEPLGINELANRMAGHTDIFPKNEFCRTNAYGLINQALSLFHKTISSWSIS